MVTPVATEPALACFLAIAYIVASLSLVNGSLISNPGGVNLWLALVY